MFSNKKIKRKFLTINFCVECGFEKFFKLRNKFPNYWNIIQLRDCCFNIL